MQSISLGGPEQINNLYTLVPPLLYWYDQNARILPWRSNSTPYRVWVSEIMLQQTRVETALPYFERFVKRLPDIQALARADESELLKLWEGLGYYSRVKNMQKTARIVMEKYDGKIPVSYEQLLEFPGIGEYTAGAIASIAFQIPVPAVDGNVLRVFSRILASRSDITMPQVKKAYRRIIQKIIPESRPGSFNQALMDLGATICIPNASPLCGSCPVAKQCEGYHQGIMDKLPVKTEDKPRKIQPLTILVITCNGRVLLRKRPQKGLLAGMWEFPSVEGHISESKILEKLINIGAQTSRIKKLKDAKHIFSHIEWLMSAYQIEVQNEIKLADCKWTDSNSINKEYAIPSAFKKYVKYISEEL